MEGNLEADGNLAAALAARAAIYGWRDRPLFRTDEVTYAHGEVHDAAVRAAAVLHASGVRRGHRVLLALPDSIGFVAALLGALRLGALAVLAGPERPPDEHAYVLADAEPTAVVCDAALADRFPGVHVLTPEDLTDEPAYVPEPAALPSGAPAYVQYTSGTTGRPKGVVHRHSDPESYFAALALGAFGVRPGDVLFSISKACNPYGLGNTVFFPMFCGGSSVLWPDRPTVAGALGQLVRHRPTILFTVPAFYVKLLAEADPAAFASLRAAGSAGEPLLPALADRLADLLGCPVLDGLGTTEVGHTFISNTVARAARGTLGVVLDPYEIAVRLPDGRPAGPGAAGALYVRGPSVMTEYLGKPEETDRVIGPGGWLRTGDVVHVDIDGFVHHHGREQDQEMVGGVLVAPLEVERVLGEHPAVAQVAVVKGPGEALRAFVVADPVAGTSGELARELLDLVRSRLAAHLVPRTVTFVRDLPRGPGGKVQRSALRRRAGG